MRRKRLEAAGLLLAAALLLGPLAAGAAQPPTRAGRRIVAIDIDCGAPIDRAGLLHMLPFRVGDLWRAAAAGVARRRLEETRLFTTIAVTAQARRDGVAVVVQLQRQPIIDVVRFRGNHALPDETLRRVARLHSGMTLSDALRASTAMRLQRHYAAEGFEAARVNVAARPSAPGEVDVVIDIEEGPPLRIAAIDIEGGTPLRAGAIRATLPIKVGQRYTHAQRRAAQAAIVSLFRRRHYYEVEVRSRWTRGAKQTGAFHFRIDSGPLFALRFTGNRHFSSAHLLGLMDLLTRPIVTDGTWRELARRARRAYQEDGYHFARVDVHIALGPPKVVRFEVREGRVYHVAAVGFEGNREVSSERLRAQMATRPPSWIPWGRGIFLDDVFADDLKRLWYFYRQQGFESARIVDARRRFDDAHGEVFVTVVVEEGPQTVVRHVKYRGFAPLGGHLPSLRVRSGAPLDREEVAADRRTLLTALAEAGYLEAVVHADVQTVADGPRRAASVGFAAEPGLRQRVGTIIVANNFDTHARVIVRQLPFQPGDPLNPDALLRGQSNVYALGLFHSVTVRPLPAPASQPVRDVGVDVSEKPPGTLQWGAGYNTRDGLRGFLEIGDNNLQGLARRLSLRGDFSFIPGTLSANQYVGNLAFREPTLGDTLWTFRTNVLAQRSTELIDPYSVTRFAVIPGIERTLLPGLRAGLEMEAEESEVFDVKPDVLAFNPRDQGNLVTVSAGPFAVYDGRDDAFVPHRGVFDSLRVKYAPGALGSDVPFVKLIGQHSQYIPVADDLTFVYAVRGGWARTLGSDPVLPIRERFFLGGRTTVRGFGEDVIGPAGPPIEDRFGRVINGGGNPLGGDLTLNLNTELRFPLVGGLGGAVFVDGGGVYLQSRAITAHDFRRSSGLGLRYITPVGPLSLDYGFKLDRRAGESVGEVHFSIGTMF